MTIRGPAAPDFFCHSCRAVQAASGVKEVSGKSVEALPVIIFRFVTFLQHKRITHPDQNKTMSTMNATSHGFEDMKLNIKIKLSALWTSVTLCYLYGDYFELYVPQKTQGLVTGANLLDTPFKLFAASVLLAIPALMVFLSVVLPPVINRRLNIFFGILFTGIMLLIAVTSLIPWRVFYVFLAVTESCLTALVVWYAWKWPKERVSNQ